jgi:hypothetical protein
MASFIENVNLLAQNIETVNNALSDIETTEENIEAINEELTIKVATATTQADVATQKATEASNSAIFSTQKANESLNSATNASNSATTASTKANEASVSAVTATEQATIATTKAGEALISASSASDSAITATEQATIATTKAEEAESARVASLVAVGQAQTIKDSIWNLNVPVKFVLGADYVATNIVINPHDLLAYIANQDIVNASSYPHIDTTNWDLYTIGVADVNGSVITVRLKVGTLEQLTGTTLALGEMAYEIDSGKLKASDGVSLYEELPYVGQNAVSWDDILNKPTGYTPISHNHNDLYYTKTQLDNGELDNRYYIKSGVNTLILANNRRIQAFNFINI